MGVKQREELLIKVAKEFGANRIGKDYLLKAAELYAYAKKMARDNRDRWKMRKRLGQ